MTVHFICRGNVFRSLAAETYLQSLNIPNIKTLSSGTNVNISDPQEREYFNNTLELLGRHNIQHLAKNESNQLTQERIEASNIIVIVNQRAHDEAAKLVNLTKATYLWNIVDIGEGDRIATQGNRIQLEELIYSELTAAVDDLVKIIVKSELSKNQPSYSIHTE